MLYDVDKQKIIYICLYICIYLTSIFYIFASLILPVFLSLSLSLSVTMLAACLCLAAESLLLIIYSFIKSHTTGPATRTWRWDC